MDAGPMLDACFEHQHPELYNREPVVVEMEAWIEVGVLRYGGEDAQRYAVDHHGIILEESGWPCEPPARLSAVSSAATSITPNWVDGCWA